jgi:hypothetical protein
VAAVQKETQLGEGLRNAAFWVHQRQDVHNAIFNQRPTRTDLKICSINRSTNEASEDVWAKRVTCLTADVVTFCFGPEASSIARYIELKEQLTEWYDCKPPSFAPIYFKESDISTGQYFPELCLTLDTCGKFCLGQCLLYAHPDIVVADHLMQVVGLAYYHLAMLLVAIYDPTQPKMGSRFVEGRKKMQVGTPRYRLMKSFV